ncbi:MAG: DNA mismatch repair endonuclease MutL [Spirochaetales bacterium]|nr:DNA mismatch repair endonuclease MutL [Spirochaetales bacterium]
MARDHNHSRRIHILRESVLRKIAAGEVIIRPFSVIRELMDNSIDAESTEVSVYVGGGGIESIRVVDTGCGMNEEDLKLCHLPHTTSKIQDDEDLYKIMTLGFRGEALASIAHCSLLSIISAVDSSGSGFKSEIREGKLTAITPHRSNRGTIVEARDLFYNMPARKNFLKRPVSEGSLCYATFIEKALPFPQTSFKFFSDSNLKKFLPAVDLPGRIATAFENTVTPKALKYMEFKGKDYSIRAVAGTPDLMMRDRKHIQVYVNNRKITEYGLVQAVEYGYTGLIPGKNHPFAVVFINVNPELVDFNIHPAKKECRLRNMPDIHHGVVSMFKNEFGGYGIAIPSDNVLVHQQKSGLDFDDYTTPEVSDKVVSTPVWKTHISSSPEKKPVIKADENAIEFLGTVFGLFIVVRKDESLYIIDQHAAHERLLFEQFRASPSPVQDLLFPISFELDPDEEENFNNNGKFLSQSGINVNRISRGQYEISSLPSDFHNLPASALIEFVKQNRGDKDELERALYSMAACRLAVKDGDEIDALTACRIAEGALSLDNPRCPHGRKIYHALSKEQLARLVDRK